MNIETNTVWRRIPANGTSGWGTEQLIVAVSDSFVITRNEFVSELFPEMNKEKVIDRAEFERDYVTKAEASRRIKETCDKFLAELREKHSAKAMPTLRSEIPPQPKLGEPALIDNNGCMLRYKASNGVIIRFTMLGHYYIDTEEGSSNPVSSYDAAWIAAKSAELRKRYDAAESRRLSYYMDSYVYPLY